MRRFFVFITSFSVGIALFILYAKSPVVTKPNIANNAIVSFSSDATILPKKNTLRIVTYNIGYAYAEKNNLGFVLTREDVLKNLDEAVEALRKLNPDIICLQEIDFDANRTYHIDQLEYLAKGLGLAHGAYAINWNKRYLPYPYWPPQKQFGTIVSGQAVLSHYPLAENQIQILEKPPNAFWYNWFYLERLAQHVKVDLGDGDVLSLWNLHLEAFHKNTRLNQARSIASDVKRNDAELKIVAGDLNDPQATDPESQNLNAAHLLIAHSGLQGDTEFKEEFTFPSWEPIEKIDHVLFSERFTFISSNTPQIKTSDHLPVVVDLLY